MGISYKKKKESGHLQLLRRCRLSLFVMDKSYVKKFYQIHDCTRSAAKRSDSLIRVAFIIVLDIFPLFFVVVIPVRILDRDTGVQDKDAGKSEK